MHGPKLHPNRCCNDKYEEIVSSPTACAMVDVHDLVSVGSEVVSSDMSSVSSTLQSVPSEVRELICKRLTPLDLCSLCQVDTQCSKVFSEEGIWRSRINGLSTKQTVLSAESKRVTVEPVAGPARLRGDFIIIDLFALFASVRSDLERQIHDLQRQSCWLFHLTYRNQSAWIVSSESYDPEPAFEISRGGTILGVNEHPSRHIAVVSKKMADIFLKENGQETLRTPEGGVSVEGVDGELICSGDGDFVISGTPQSSGRHVSRWIEDDCVRNADVLCCAGGRWTFCDDSTDEDDDEDITDLEDDGEITDCESSEGLVNRENVETCFQKDADDPWSRQEACLQYQRLSTDVQGRNWVRISTTEQ